MGFTPYLTHALLPAEADLSSVADRLAAQWGERAQLRWVAGRSELYHDGHGFFLHLETDVESKPDVFEECTRMLKIIGTSQEQTRRYPALLSYGGIDPDPEMDAFNDFVFLCEVVEKLFPDAILYDPQTGLRL